MSHFSLPPPHNSTSTDHHICAPIRTLNKASETGSAPLWRAWKTHRLFLTVWWRVTGNGEETQSDSASWEKAFQNRCPIHLRGIYSTGAMPIYATVTPCIWKPLKWEGASQQDRFYTKECATAGGCQIAMLPPFQKLKSLPTSTFLRLRCPIQLWLNTSAHLCWVPLSLSLLEHNATSSRLSAGCLWCTNTGMGAKMVPPSWD